MIIYFIGLDFKKYLRMMIFSNGVNEKSTISLKILNVQIIFNMNYVKYETKIYSPVSFKQTATCDKCQ